MAELKRAPKRVASAADRWLLDVETEESLEVVVDPYAGRFFGDQLDYEAEDSELDRLGSHSPFSF